MKRWTGYGVVLILTMAMVDLDTSKLFAHFSLVPSIVPFSPSSSSSSFLSPSLVSTTSLPATRKENSNRIFVKAQEDGEFLEEYTVDAPDEGGAPDEEFDESDPVFDDEELELLNQAAESFEFQAEVSRLMDIIINSLYKSKEIFLRELISNASDALDKIRFLAVSDKHALDSTNNTENEELSIKVSASKKSRTITLRDTGIGMTRDDLVANLGTVAKSGTSNFMEALSNAENMGDISQIGQFGVGFYSVYLVADKVRVVSKNNQDDQYVWESTADSVFTVSKDPRGNTLGRGTEITLFLKEDALAFAEEHELKSIIGRYSQFINFPIYQQVITKKMVDEDEDDEGSEEEEEEEEEEEVEGEEEEDDEEEVIEDEENSSKGKQIEKEVIEWKRVNSNQAIWSRSKDEITKEEYEEFYKHDNPETAHMAPMDWIHFKAEGEMDFKALMYIPGEAPHNLYDSYYSTNAILKLYVKKVLISDEFEELLPRYLSFIVGIVDSDDLPLNVSRETLQQHKLLKVMGKKLTRKVLEMLRKMKARTEKMLKKKQGGEEEEEDDDEEEEEVEGSGASYIDFWKEFGRSIKLGVVEDPNNREKLTKLLMFQTANSEEDYISLQSYVDAMPDWQKNIYYIAGESMSAVSNSPFMEKFRKKGIDVLYLIDGMDEYSISHVQEYGGFKLQAITKEGLKFGDEDEKTLKKISKYYKSQFEPITEYLKHILDSDVTSVTISNRIESSPSVVVTGRFGHSANMDRIMRAQTMLNENKLTGLTAQKTMELNPRHPLVISLNDKVSEFEDVEEIEDPELESMAWLLYDSALLDSGFVHNDAKSLSSRILRVLQSGLQLQDVNLVSEIDIEDVEEWEAKKAEEDGEEEEEEDEDEDSMAKLGGMGGMGGMGGGGSQIDLNNLPEGVDREKLEELLAQYNNEDGSPEGAETGSDDFEEEL